MIDYSDLQTAHTEFNKSVEAYKEAVDSCHEAERKLMLKEASIHKEFFGKVLSGERSMALFESLVKNQTFNERLEFKTGKKVKAICLENKNQAWENLQVSKRLINL